jgi:hypothetical protein
VTADDFVSIPVRSKLVPPPWTEALEVVGSMVSSGDHDPEPPACVLAQAS